MVMPGLIIVAPLFVTNTAIHFAQLYLRSYLML